MERSDLTDTMPLQDKAATLCSDCAMRAQSMTKFKIELTVDFHPSGNRTLKFKGRLHPLPIDFGGPLLINNDQSSFYRAVAQKIADLSQQGLTVTYNDSSQ